MKYVAVNWFKPSLENSNVKSPLNSFYSLKFDEFAQDRKSVPLPFELLNMSNGSITSTSKKNERAACDDVQSKVLPS